MNKVLLVGRLTKIAQFTEGPERDRAFFVLAVNTGYGDNNAVDFVPITCFGKKGNGFKNLVQYLVKGREILVEGRVKVSFNKEKQLQMFSIISDKIQLLGKAPLDQPTGAPVAQQPVKQEAPVESNELSGFVDF